MTLQSLRKDLLLAPRFGLLPWDQEVSVPSAKEQRYPRLLAGSPLGDCACTKCTERLGEGLHAN